MDAFIWVWSHHVYMLTVYVRYAIHDDNDYSLVQLVQLLLIVAAGGLGVRNVNNLVAAKILFDHADSTPLRQFKLAPIGIKNRGCLFRVGKPCC